MRRSSWDETDDDITDSTIPALLLTPEQVATALSWGRSKTYQLLARGEIPSVLVGSSRRVRVSDLEAYVDGLATTQRREEL